MDRYLYGVYVASRSDDYRFYLYASSSSVAISKVVSAFTGQVVVRVECEMVSNVLPLREGA